MENTDYTNISKRKFTEKIIIILCGVVTLLNVGLIIYNEYPTFHKYSMDVYRENLRYGYEGARADLIRTIDAYIDDVAPKSFLNGSAIFDACDEYNIDMVFALSQGHLESYFGTAGIAARTNSVCNVGAYDGKSGGDIMKGPYHYKHPDMSIKPWAKLLCDEYLVDGKTEKDMMIKYINKSGKRYASAPDYENKLFSIYQKVSVFTAPGDTVTLSEKIFTYNKFKSLVEN